MADFVRQFYGWAYIWSKTVWSYLFCFFSVINILAGIYITIDFSRKTGNPLKKKQAKIIYTSSIITIILGGLVNIVLPFMRIYTIPQMANVFVLVMASGMVYAIIKYRLFVLSPAAAAENIIETMSDVLLLIDTEGRIKHVNSAALDLLGYKEKEMMGQPSHILFGQDPFRLESVGVEELVRRSPVNSLETHFVTKDGREIPVLFSSSIMRDEWGDSQGVVCVARDDTERREAVEELRKAKEAAEVADRVKSEFLANMSHEIRTPMNPILNFTDLLLEEERQPAKRKKLKMIHKAGKNLLNLINDILDFSKIETGKMKFKQSNFSLFELFDRIRSIFKVKAGEKNLLFNIRVDESVPGVVCGDERMIYQVILNLVDNAFKFTEKGSVSVDCRYEYDDKHNGTAIIKVSDTGIGIPGEKQGAIFSAFRQLDTSCARKYGGTGLGLAISKNLAEEMGGKISLESMPGQGSIFTVELPLPGVKGNVDHMLEKGEKMVRQWISIADGDPVIENALLKGIKTVPGKLARLKKAISGNDQEEIKSIVHDIKDFSGNYGMVEIYTLIEKIDEEIKKPGYDLHKIRKLFNDLKEIADAIPNRFKGLIDVNSIPK